MSDLQQQPVKEFTDEGQQPNLLCLSSRDLEINENQWCVCWGVLVALDLVHSCVPVPSIPPQHDPRPTKQSFITFPELAAWPEIWALMSFFCVVFLLFEKVPGLTLILLHAELWNHSLHPHKSSFRWSCTKNWQETCGGGGRNRGSNYQFADVWSQFDIWNIWSCEEASLLFSSWAWNGNSQQEKGSVMAEGLGGRPAQSIGRSSVVGGATRVWH